MRGLSIAVRYQMLKVDLRKLDARNCSITCPFAVATLAAFVRNGQVGAGVGSRQERRAFDGDSGQHESKSENWGEGITLARVAASWVRLARVSR